MTPAGGHSGFFPDVQRLAELPPNETEAEQRTKYETLVDRPENRGWRKFLTVDIVLLALDTATDANGVEELDLAILMIRRGEKPYLDRWALPGGFVKEHSPATGEDGDVDLLAAAHRELKEETGLDAEADGIQLQQLKTYYLREPNRDPRGAIASVAFVALVPADEKRLVSRLAPTGKVKGGGDAREAQWWTRARSTELIGKLAFDHAEIIDDAIAWAGRELERTSVATEFLADAFTIADIRKVYEAVWGVELDPANFRRKVLANSDSEGEEQPFVLGSGRKTRAGGRPAELYERGSAERHDLRIPIRRPRS